MPQKPLDISTPLFYPRAEEQQHHFRVSSRVMPMPPGQTKVFGFAPTWCTTKYLARSCGIFFLLLVFEGTSVCAPLGTRMACCGGDRRLRRKQRVRAGAAVAEDKPRPRGAGRCGNRKSVGPWVRPGQKKCPSEVLLERGRVPDA